CTSVAIRRCGYGCTGGGGRAIRRSRNRPSRSIMPDQMSDRSRDAALDAAFDPARILILSPNWLGDAVMALPAIADMRRRFPRARLVVVARRAVAGVFNLAPVVDEVL